MQDQASPLTGPVSETELRSSLEATSKGAAEQKQNTFSVLTIGLGGGASTAASRKLHRFLCNALQHPWCHTEAGHCLVLLPRTDRRGAERLKRQLLIRLNTLNRLAAAPVYCSIGFATSHEVMLSTDALIARSLRRMLADRMRGQARRNTHLHALLAPATSGTPGGWRISINDLPRIAQAGAHSTDKDLYN